MCVPKMPDSHRPGDAPAPDRSRRFARSHQMVRCLRDERLYSEKRARDMLFQAMERLLSESAETGSTQPSDGAMIIARLTREAAQVAQHESARVGYEFSNWTAASAAVTKTLLCSSSLLSTDGAPIAFGVSAHAAPVSALREDYRDRAEAFLLQVLLQRLGDVTPRDHMALAHALFRQFDRNVPMEDLEDRVVILLARLADRVVMAGDVYVVVDAALTAPSGDVGAVESV